jgi:hypothetical protein
MNTSKLFYSVVVVGMALAAESACSSSTTPSPEPTADAGGSNDAATVGDSGAHGGDASPDALAGWVCCG